MKFKKRFFKTLILVGLGMTIPTAAGLAVDAVNGWTRCPTTLNASTALAAHEAAVNSKAPKCFEFNETQSTTDFTIDIKVSEAKICLLTDTESATVGDVRASLYDCQRGLAATTSTCSTNAVKAYTTDACFSVTNGIYLFDITTAVTSGEVAIVYVQPYGPQ